MKTVRRQEVTWNTAKEKEFTMCFNLFIRHTVPVIALLMISGCSGSSGSGTPSLPPPPPPEAPTLNLSIGMKQLLFSWDAVEGAAFYRLLENADGVSGFSQIGSNLESGATTYAHEISVHLQDWINARYMVEACNSSGCSESNDIDASSSNVRAIGYVKASNSDGADSFGRSVAVSGDGGTLAIGANGEDSNATTINGDQTNNSAGLSGAVYIFYKNNSGTWEQQAYIKGSSMNIIKSFGWDVALSHDGNTLAVSAPTDGKTVPGSGVVYIYGRDGSNFWTEKSILEPSNPEMKTEPLEPYDNFGNSIALSGNGNSLVVGSPWEDSDAVGIDGDDQNNNRVNSGAVYLFTRDTNGAWTQEAYLKASNPNGGIGSTFGGTIGDQFGWDVDINSSGNVIVVGAPTEDSSANTVDGDQESNALEQSGAAYVFKKGVDGWEQKAYLKASNSGGGWSTFCGLIACIDGDQFGYSVSISGDGFSIAVGSVNEESATTIPDDNTLRSAGAVYLFDENVEELWQQNAYIKPSNTTGYADPENTILSGDRFGFSLDLNNDGTLLAVGAPHEDGNATGVNGDVNINNSIQSGAVYLFQISSIGEWNQTSYIKSSNTDGNTTQSVAGYFGDLFGSSVKLSATGSVLVVGAPNEGSDSDIVNSGPDDNSAFAAGAAYLY